MTPLEHSRPSRSPSATTTADPSATRRDFLKSGTAATVAGALLGTSAISPRAYAAGDDIIRVGLVGCGDRGTGAANQALMADESVHLVAMGDAFSEQINRKLRSLKAQKRVADRVQVDEDHRFVGLDAYKHVTDACDVVLLAAPPGFRPEHLAYAVEKNKHVFCEKPMATDPVGARWVVETVKKSKENGKSLVSGFCWRYHLPHRAFFEKVLNGDIGELPCVYGTYMATRIKEMPPASQRPDGMTDLEWMVHNWYNFTWLSGDLLVEQACHAVDWLMWAKGDVPPVRCTALGGRQIPQEGGNIFDHIEVNYEWEDGSRGFLAQRQMANCYNDNSCYLLGSKGQGRIRFADNWFPGTDWKYDGPAPNMYQVEHNELFESIRKGEPINDGDRMINSTMAAIMGRTAGYTGKELSWEEIWKSDEKLVFDTPDWNAPVTFRPVPMPGLM